MVLYNLLNIGSGNGLLLGTTIAISEPNERVCYTLNLHLHESRFTGYADMND